MLDNHIIDVTVYGTVYNSYNGQPLENAIIYDENGKCGSTVTGTDGYYEYNFKISYGSYITIVAEKRNYNKSSYRLNFTDSAYKIEKQCRMKLDFLLR